MSQQVQHQHPNQPPKVKLNISDTSAVVCPCGHDVYAEGMMLRRVSVILAGPGQPAITPISVVYCVKCGKAVTELLPADLQPAIEV